MKQLGAVCVALALVMALLSGCAESSDYTARFVRYDTLEEDDTRVAVVVPEASGDMPEEQAAFVTLDDLEAGDRVLIKDVGKDWDAPQWTPTRAVVGRAEE